MPVFNERATVGAAVDELLGAELVLVDDGSADGTRELLGNGNWAESVHVHLRDRNGGKGAAVRTGLGLASGRHATVLDADLEYRAEAIRDLLAPVAAGDADAAFGIRGFRAHSAIHEVPAPYGARGRDEGKKLTALDGLRVLRTLPRCRLRGG